MAAVILVATVSSCGENVPRYESAEACSVDAQRVADVLGTDLFTTTDNGNRLPMFPGGGGVYLCEVYLDDPRPSLTIRVELSDDLDLSDVNRWIDDVGAFPVVDGQGRAGVKEPDDPERDDLASHWTCVRITGRMSATVADPDPKAARALTEDLSEAAGCHDYAIPGPPSGNGATG